MDHSDLTASNFMENFIGVKMITFECTHLESWPSPSTHCSTHPPVFVVCSPVPCLSVPRSSSYSLVPVAQPEKELKSIVHSEFFGAHPTSYTHKNLPVLSFVTRSRYLVCSVKYLFIGVETAKFYTCPRTSKWP